MTSEATRCVAVASMKLRICITVLLLTTVECDPSSELPPHQKKHLLTPSSGHQNKLPSAFSGGTSSLNLNSISVAEKYTSKNEDVYVPGRDFPKINNIHLRRKHDVNLENNAYVDESEFQASHLDDENVRRKRSPLSHEGNAFIGEGSSRTGQNIRGLSKYFNARYAAPEISHINGRDEKRLAGDRPDAASPPIDDVAADEVDVLGTSASSENDFNNGSNNAPVFPVKKSEIEACRFGINFKRELPLHNGVYERITCFFCHLFIAPHRKKFELQYNFASYTFSYGNWTNEVFDPSAESWTVVRDSLIDDVEADKLERCCAGAVDCCHSIDHGPQPPETGEECPATWDGWSCVRDTVPAGTTVPVKCPDIAYTGFPECYLYAEKTCTADGTWLQRDGNEYTDYTLCSMESYHVLLYWWELCVHCVSIVVLLPALLVLLCYRKLHKPWFYMLVNFYMALLLRSVFVVVELAVIKIPENKNEHSMMEENGVGCKVIVSLRKLFVTSVWVWMLATSVFLYRTVARALSKVYSILVYCVPVWGTTALLTGVWATCRALLEDYQCWLGDYKGDPYKLHLITDIPIVLSLLVSVGLLAHMGYLLHDTMRSTHDDEKVAQRKSFRATVFLVPIFGLQFVLTAIVFTGVDCRLLKINMMFGTALTGLQGVYCSVVYCFMNAEVKKELQKTWSNMAERLGGGDSAMQFGHSSTAPQTTYSTVHSDHGDAGAVELVPLKREEDLMRID